MNDFGIVFTTELLRKLRSRIFWFATLGGVVAIAVLTIAPFFFASFALSSSSDVVLAGAPGLRQRAAELMTSSKDYRVVARVAALPKRVTAAYLQAHGKAGAAVAVSIVRGRLHLDVYPRDLAAYDDVRFSSLVPLAVSIDTGLPSHRIERDTAIAKIIHPIDARFKDTRAATIAHAVAFGLVFMLYLAIILGSQTVMASVAEEKTSRIAEILIATIEPATLLYGKTLSAALVALVQVILWIVTAAVLLPISAHNMAQSLGASATATPGANAASFAFDPLVLVTFFALFVLGYLQYAAIYAAAASLVSRTEELASVTTPVILPVIGAFFVAQYAIVNPTSPLVVACSFVPYLSPFVAFTRIAVSSVPHWQIALALVVNVAVVALSFWAAGKVYRIGMLLYGRAPSVAQVIAALRA